MSDEQFVFVSILTECKPGWRDLVEPPKAPSNYKSAEAIDSYIQRKWVELENDAHETPGLAKPVSLALICIGSDRQPDGDVWVGDQLENWFRFMDTIMSGTDSKQLALVGNNLLNRLIIAGESVMERSGYLPKFIGDIFFPKRTVIDSPIPYYGCRIFDAEHFFKSRNIPIRPHNVSDIIKWTGDSASESQDRELSIQIGAMRMLIGDRLCLP